jgi:hypothetical protein
MTDDKERKPKPKQEIPVPGPHARPELMDKDKTPGSGMLPEPDDPNLAPSG